MDLRTPRAGTIAALPFNHSSMALAIFVLLFVGGHALAEAAVAEISKPRNNNVNCVIPIGSKRDYVLQWPLIYTPKGELYPTDVDDESSELKVLINAGDEVLLSCGPNYLKQFGRREILNVRCNGATGNFTVDHVEKSPKDLTCDLRVIEEVIDDVSGCDAATSRFGFVDPMKETAVLLGEACYDTTAGVTKFVHFKLGDKTGSFIEEQSKNYLTSHRHPDGRYKIELFRGLRFDEIYERIRTTLRTGDILPLLKMAHYLDEPLLGSEQFQAAKKLGWNYYVGSDENESLEALKRDIKLLSGTKNLDIYIGSYGVKELKGIDGSKMELYLHEASKRFPMPALIWFVVKSEDAATAFAVQNDDDISGNNIIEAQRVSEGVNAICKNSFCEKISWLSAGLKQITKFVCCDVNDFRRAVPNVPFIANIKKTLL